MGPSVPQLSAVSPFPPPPSSKGKGCRARHAGSSGAQASLTEHQKLEVPLGGARLVLCLAGVEARVARLDAGKVEGPGLVQEAVAAHLRDLGRRGQRELVSRGQLPSVIGNKETKAQGASWRQEPGASDS